MPENDLISESTPKKIEIQSSLKNVPQEGKGVERAAEKTIHLFNSG